MGAEVAIAAAAIGAAGGIMGGIQQEKAGREEAMQTLKDTRENAARRRSQLEKFKGKQRMAYLESGVLLEGSPLLVLEETEQQGAQEIQDMTEQGFRKANKLRRAGRDAFVGSIFSAASSMGQTVGNSASKDAAKGGK